ncbi:Clr6 histone deacetylase complex subunit Pst1, partial [Reticulomyxa filosa]
PPPPPPPPPPTSSSVNGTFVNANRADEDFQKAIKYVTDIRNRFSHKPDVYQQFLHLLQMYQQAHSSKSTYDEQSVTTQIRDLFKSHPDLYRCNVYVCFGCDRIEQQFSYFLRNSSGVRGLGLGSSATIHDLSSATNTNTTSASANPNTNVNVNGNLNMYPNPNSIRPGMNGGNSSPFGFGIGSTATSQRILPPGSHLGAGGTSGLKNNLNATDMQTQLDHLNASQPALKRVRLNNGNAYPSVTDSTAKGNDYHVLTHKPVDRSDHTTESSPLSKYHYPYDLSIFNDLEMKIPKTLFDQFSQNTISYFFFFFVCVFSPQTFNFFFFFLA